MAEPAIATLTINPAIDVSTAVDRLVPFTKMRCRPAHRDPGGGGINVARVLQRLGVATTAIYPAGGGSGDLLQQLMAREELTSLVVPGATAVREDITVFDEGSGAQYRLVFPGEPLAAGVVAAALAALDALQPAPRLVVGSGSLPPGVAEDFYGEVVRRATRRGARAAIDAPGPLLRPALEQGAFLIKPNLGEFQALAGTASADERALVAAGRHLIGRYGVTLIALSLGPAGALLISADQALRAGGLPVHAKTVSGAGDCFLAGLLWRLLADDGLADALRFAVAAGSAALLRPGTQLAQRDDIARLAAEVSVTAIGPAP
jgi:6-phosphofructokinase 2